MQHAECAALGGKLVGPRGVRHRALRNQRDDRVHTRIDTFDPRQMRRHHLARGYLFAADLRDQLNGAEITEFVAAARGRRCTTRLS